MFDLIKGVITQPTDTFRVLADRATVRQAGAIVLIVALLVIAPVFAFVSGFTVQVSLATTKLLSYLLIWLAVGWISGKLAVWAAKGAGTVRASLVIAGFAAIPLGLNVLLGVVLGAVSASAPMLQLVRLFCVGWAILLLYIGTREIHDLSGRGVALCISPAVIAGLVLVMVQNRVENYLVCFSPAPEIAVVTWDELPEGHEQALENPGFEEELAEDAAQDDGARGIPVAPGWRAKRPSPFAFLTKPSWEVDRTQSRTGQRAARLELAGVPQADATVSVYQEILKPPVGETVHLSVWMKTEAAVIAAGRAVFLTDNAQAPVAGAFTTTVIEGSSPWTEYRAKGVVPEGAKRAMVEVLLAGSGTVWIDDCALYFPPPKTEAELAEEEGRAPATLESAPERLVAELRKNAPEGALEGRPTIFVAPVGDRTAERFDTARLRNEIESLLTADNAAVPVNRRNEQAAGLNEIGFLGGRFVSRSDAQDRARQAGVDLVFFAEMSGGESPGRNALTVWMMDVAQGEIVAKAEVPVGSDG